MGKANKKKKFIDRKNAVTFHLVHRSQQDPLVADETAPQRVLIPVGEKQPKQSQASSKLNPQKRKEEQQKYGIYFDDEYDYLQHLRESKDVVCWERVDSTSKKSDETKPKINLPSCVFESTVEEKVGLLNKAAPQSGLRLDLDPDIVAAMDDDFDYSDPENELEDNFMELANADCDDDEDFDADESDVDSNVGYGSEEDDEVGSLNCSQFSFSKEETKSRFTEYSMSSSVIKRNGQLTLLDERFEKEYEKYDDGNIGALDSDNMDDNCEDNTESVVLASCIEEFEKANESLKLENDATVSRALNMIEEGYSDEEFVPFDITKVKKLELDCESVLSLNSNTYNHPQLITEPKIQKIKINHRTQMPEGVLGANKLTAKNLARFDNENLRQGPTSVCESVISKLSMLSVRSKSETPEEKRERKKRLKEYRSERRQEKKANSLAFKEEKKHQEKIIINNKNNLQGNRIL